jgi:hypothetical protein
VNFTDYTSLKSFQFPHKYDIARIHAADVTLFFEAAKSAADKLMFTCPPAHLTYHQLTGGLEADTACNVVLCRFGAFRTSEDTSAALADILTALSAKGKSVLPKSWGIDRSKLGPTIAKS